MVAAAADTDLAVTHVPRSEPLGAVTPATWERPDAGTRDGTAGETPCSNPHPAVTSTAERRATSARALLIFFQTAYRLGERGLSHKSREQVHTSAGFCTRIT